MQELIRSIQFLLIDPQNDFCDLPQSWRPTSPLDGQTLSPALPVAGAHQDCLRLAQVITEGASVIEGITITLDSHHRVDIAHPPFWVRADGQAVPPFTVITADQVRQGHFAPRDPQAMAYVLAYLDELEALGRYNLMIWPIHCEIGTWGHGVHAAVQRACNAWEESQLACVQHIYKGANPWTEHYSAIEAEVPDDQDPDTQLNLELVNHLDLADLIFVGGQASSHCVRATVEHLTQNLPSGQMSKIVLVTDCMSPVGGFEGQAKTFFEDMQKRGVQLTTAQECIAFLQANAKTLPARA